MHLMANMLHSTVNRAPKSRYSTAEGNTRVVKLLPALLPGVDIWCSSAEGRGWVVRTVSRRRHLHLNCTPKGCLSYAKEQLKVVECFKTVLFLPVLCFQAAQPTAGRVWGAEHPWAGARCLRVPPSERRLLPARAPAGRFAPWMKKGRC